MRHVLAALALLAGLTAANAQNVSTARVGVTPTANPEPVYVLDKNSVWNQIGTMAGGTFTPVPSSVSGDINIATWNNVAVGSPTAAGVIGTGNYPNINAYLTSAGLATTSAPALTESQPTTFSFDRSGNLRIVGGNSAPLGTQPIANSQAVNPATGSVWGGPLSTQPIVNSQAVNPATGSVWSGPLGAQTIANSQAVTPATGSAWGGPLGTQAISNSQAVNPATGAVWTITPTPALGAQPIASAQSVTPATGSVWTTTPTPPLGTQAISNSQAVNPATSSVWTISAPPSAYPATAVPITASATGTTAATTATLTAVSTHLTYICGFSIRANATAAATGNATVTGTVSGTLNFTQWTAPNASGIGVNEQLFSPCVPASAVSTNIAVISAVPGTGGVVSVTAWGYSI